MSDNSCHEVGIFVDGRYISAMQGELLIDVLYREGIEIPSLCYSPGLSCTGSCRACLVQKEGRPTCLPACEIPVTDGLSVSVSSSLLLKERREVLSMLIEHYIDEDQNANPHTELNYWLRRYQIHPPEVTPRHQVDSDPHPAIRVDLNKCILCTRCIRACNDIQGRFVWGLAERADHSQLIAGIGESMLEAGCESCGACVDYCPSGALSDRHATIDIDEKVMTTCAYCGVGCNFDLNIKNGRVVSASPNTHAPVNGMHLCVKGRYGVDFVHHPERLTQPLVRSWLLDGTSRPDGNRRGEWIAVSWEKALDIVARKFSLILDESGSDAFALFSSAKCTNEENYLMQKFARQVIGTHNIDHCARLCHSSTVAGLAAALGSGAMSNTMKDIASQSEAIFVIGSNTTEQHPVFGSMIRQAVRQRGVKLVVADPRKIDLTEFATLHLRQRPGTDIALVNGIMHLIIENNWQEDSFIEERTEGYEVLRDSLAKYTPAFVSSVTGVAEADIREAAHILGTVKPMATIWAMGITQHIVGVQNVFSLANLQLLTGNLGVPGAGVNPLRGQNNVQGACDMGCLPNVLPGYQAVSNSEVIAKFTHAWALSNHNHTMNSTPGQTLTEMLDKALDGTVRAFYILAENPIMSDPDVNHVREAMTKAEFTVLQEIFPSETAEYADVLLPGASFAEKEGSFTNTERRVQLIHDAVSPPGEAKKDWEITAEIAKRVLALRQQQAVGEFAGWNYQNAAQIMDEVAALTPSYTGVNHSRLHNGEQLHWPVKDVHHPGTPILHVDTFTRGKGLFHVTEHLPAQEQPDEDYPMCLTTGRVLYHWHGAEMTRRSETLTALYPSSLVEISLKDATRLGIEQMQRIRIVSRRGEMLAFAEVSERVPEGLVFGNFHFPDDENVNNLTIGALDPIAKIPEYKVCAVRVETEF